MPVLILFLGAGALFWLARSRRGPDWNTPEGQAQIDRAVLRALALDSDGTPEEIAGVVAKDIYPGKPLPPTSSRSADPKGWEIWDKLVAVAILAIQDT